MEISVILILVLLHKLCSALDSNNCTYMLPINETDFRYKPKLPQMRFYLFTTLNPIYEQQLYVNNKIHLLNSNFNHLWPTRLIIAGWSNKFMSCTNAILKDAYLMKGNFNIIIVDWGDWSINVNYYLITLLIKQIGQHIVDFTNFLTKYGQISYDDIYLIGHSLGAQIAGAAGQLIKPEQYNTIFALDAAGPAFNYVERHKRIDETDAKYVESITTNMGTLGYQGIIGHASFYPNYGRKQTHCQYAPFGCSHYAAVLYFAESINTKTGFCAVHCDYKKILCKQCDYNNGDRNIRMGGEPSTPKYGTFYLKTRMILPFEMNDGHCLN